LRYTASTRRMYAKLGANHLDAKSKRMRLAGRGAREKFAEAFVRAVESAESGKPTRKQFKAECKNVGISPMLIMFLLNVAWQLLFYWWTHRDES
jgi:hypothetical protein